MRKDTKKNAGLKKTNWEILKNELKTDADSAEVAAANSNKHRLVKQKQVNQRKRKLEILNTSETNHKKQKQSNESTAKKNDIHLKKLNKHCDKKPPVDLWFDDIPFEEIMEAENASEPTVNFVVSERNSSETSKVAKRLVKANAFGGLTKVVAMDCEMVGVGEGGRESVLARVSLVNQFGKCIYDKHVKPREEVTDYRTFVSGIRPSDLVDAEEFEVVQKEVFEILQGRILVGHALWNDMKVLFLDHPKKCIRDTAKYRPFKTMVGGRSPALRVLSSKVLGVQVQKGEHSSVQDAQAAMRLYTVVKKEWEAEKKQLSKGQRKKMKCDAFIQTAKENSKT